MRFEFPFNLIGKSTIAFLAGQSRCVLKPWYTSGPEQGLWHCLADGLYLKFSSVGGTAYSVTSHKNIISSHIYKIQLYLFM